MSNLYKSSLFKDLSSHDQMDPAAALYGSVSPQKAADEYWAAYEHDGGKSVREQNFSEYSRQLLAQSRFMNSNARNVAPSSSPSPSSSPLPATSLTSGGAYASVRYPTLMNSLHGRGLEDSVADNWLVLPTPKLTASGQVENMVSLQTSNIHSSASPKEVEALPVFQELLEKEEIDLNELRLLVQQAEVVSPEYRALSWQLLFEYLPTTRSLWNSTLKTKRASYYKLALEHFIPPRSKGTPRGALDYLIKMDVSRTHPQGFSHLFANPKISASLHRMLFIWAQAHPGIDYFQGLNELAVPFYLVFLTSSLGALSDFHEEYASNKHLKPHLDKFLPAVEADAYWCVDALIAQIGKVYSFSVGGLFAEPMVERLDLLVKKTHPTLSNHLENVLDIPLIQFTFRWLLCLMTRELAPRNAILLWDQCLAEGKEGFPVFQLYLSAAFLGLLAPSVLEVDDMGKAMYILQKPPTSYWDESNVQQLVWLARQLYVDVPPGTVFA
eukprot:TRINITY_DN1015_c0_g1_i1.p1 TRINITY_DN1015_c0_g1~~TRINITY_DN1015_c0_g1_i1.p1  ORF type:complete len:514 (+),score=110.11 TRINITY_DN1015_c0_g1_i1:54-1544(+)